MFSWSKEAVFLRYYVRLYFVSPQNTFFPQEMNALSLPLAGKFRGSEEKLAMGWSLGPHFHYRELSLLQQVQNVVKCRHDLEDTSLKVSLCMASPMWDAIIPVKNDVCPGLLLLASFQNRFSCTQTIQSRCL